MPINICAFAWLNTAAKFPKPSFCTGFRNALLIRCSFQAQLGQKDIIHILLEALGSSLLRKLYCHETATFICDDWIVTYLAQLLLSKMPLNTGNNCFIIKQTSCGHSFVCFSVWEVMMMRDVWYHLMNFSCKTWTLSHACCNCHACSFGWLFSFTRPGVLPPLI